VVELKRSQRGRGLQTHLSPPPASLPATCTHHGVGHEGRDMSIHESGNSQRRPDTRPCTSKQPSTRETLHMQDSNCNNARIRTCSNAAHQH
jgi:hypothetical protein